MKRHLEANEGELEDDKHPKRARLIEHRRVLFLGHLEEQESNITEGLERYVFQETPETDPRLLELIVTFLKETIPGKYGGGEEGEDQIEVFIGSLEIGGRAPAVMRAQGTLIPSSIQAGHAEKDGPHGTVRAGAQGSVDQRHGVYGRPLGL